MDISKRIKDMSFSEIRKLIPFANEAKKKGIKVYHLNIGQPDVKTPKEFFDAVNNYKGTTIKYENSQGMVELIQSFIKYYKGLNITLDEDEVYITNGASEGILYALMTICDFGDEIIVPEPYYTNYNNIAKLAGVNIRSFKTFRQDGFHLRSKEEIVNNISENTKAILVSNPGNPTGVVYTKEEVRLLSDIAKEHNLYILADEVYREFVYDGLKHTSFMYMEDILDRIILIDSISKRYSACGARVGMIASKNKNVSKEFLKLCQSRLSVSSLDQVGAANLINVSREYFKEVNEEYENRRNILYNGLSSIEGIECEKPSGAFYIIAKLPVEDANDFAKWLLTDFNYENKTVMITPASGFYATKERGKDEVRLSYCINSEDLKEAIIILTKALQSYKNKSN
ncbi:aspartate aminotransferase [Clostridium tetanomorphum]|uniref:Aminotransferase n=1 Tax=Clostridium tetanomorphum TaxID=1553 RepID=A0A923J373_CLOTT|nr:pyridoxal phosphate-dependent aminotransferase [Clostridium tetanomorphum]KAJ52517.1 aspartate aminotransferase [Clostridium tetanomorphum DSM 665]MBC2399803.1 pyridoxal phosphate-dependent aminotransferase [Clostridium tetanomorphum]MBP1864196.1 aspartate aminotransferase [Clostridium tetanomorphum]NRS84609.1 aspartate aminotransferase [Clostridium tetanomorphum]NRZ97824.1 aspartate aminotransferase [Clostridium tetanomorphum]